MITTTHIFNTPAQACAFFEGVEAVASTSFAAQYADTRPHVVITYDDDGEDQDQPHTVDHTLGGA